MGRDRHCCPSEEEGGPPDVTPQFVPEQFWDLAADNFCVCCALSLGSGFTLRAHSRPVRQEPRSSHFADREAEKQQLGVLEPTLVRVRLPSTPSSWPQSWIAGEEWTTLGSRVEEVRDGGRCQRSIRLHWDGGGAFLVAPLLLGPAS